MTSLILPRTCDRAAARALYPELRDAIGASTLPVDASKVERIGLAMLQLLASAAISEAGIAIRAPSDAFCDAIKLSGLQSVLDEEIAE